MGVPLSLAGAAVGQVFLVVSGISAARLLGPTDRGILAEVALVGAIAVAILALGIPLALTYEVSRHPEQFARAGATARHLLGLQGFAAVPLSLLALLILGGLDELGALVIGALAVPALLAQVYVLALVQGCRDYLVLNLLRLTGPALYAVVLVVSLAVAGEAPLVFVVLVWFVANLVAAAVAWRVVLRPVAPGEPLPVRPLAAFGLRGMLGSTSPLETFRVDQIVVAALFPAAALGQYVVALAFSNLPRFVGQSIGLVAYPQVARQPDPSASKRSVRRYTAAGTAIVALSCAVLLVVVRPATVILFGPEFAEAAVIAPVLVVAGGLAGIRRLLTDAARGAGYVTAGTVAEVASWIVFIAIVPIGIAAAGTLGVALGMVASSVVGLAVLVAALLQRRPDGASGDLDGMLVPVAEPVS